MKRKGIVSGSRVMRARRVIESLIKLVMLSAVISMHIFAQVSTGLGKTGALVQSVVDVDVDIPSGRNLSEDSVRHDAVAVVVGISRYKKVPNVDYAKRDAETMKQYLIKMFGYSKDRIILVEDQEATLAELKSAFEERLFNLINPGKSDVFIYYSGHGVPDLASKEPFFVPYDCDPTYPRSTGYNVKQLYDYLARLNVRSVTVVIDACFSGNSERGTLIGNASPVSIQVQNPVAALDKGVVFTSSDGQQLSSWFPEKRHGLFTYYFFKGLRGDADENGDREITVAEMAKYLSLHVPEGARSRNRIQTPQVLGWKSGVLIRY